MRRLIPAVLFAPLLAWATAPQPADFAWRAPIEAAPASGLARLAVPGEALARSRTPGLADLRVFNASGEPVAFAIRRPAAKSPEPTTTDRLAALPLSRTPAAKGAGGSRQIQVRVAGAQGESVWVQMGGSGNDASVADPLPSVLVDLRQEKRTLAALRIDGELPANTPVRLSAWTSTDLADWEPLPLRGSLYRFEGAAGLDNRTLRLESPRKLDGRYLRLEWDAQAGVRVAGVFGVIASEATRERVIADLPAPAAVEGGLEWAHESAVPAAALALSTPKAGTLVPVRVLGRRDPSRPWTVLAQSVVFRLGAPGSEITNPPVALPGSAPRWLRVEPLRGLPLGEVTARVEYEPVELVFLAATAPLRLAVGRAETPAADVPTDTLLAAAPGGFDALPQARAGSAETRAAAASTAPAWWPRQVSPTTAVLWAVLLVGVLVLAVVAFRLMRQLNRAAPPDAGP